MATKKDDGFEFEVEGEEIEVETKASPKAKAPEIEVEDDTPEADRGRTPMPKEIVEELENDELEDYSEKVKVRLTQMKKVWHDERREKERAAREREEATDFAKKVLDENKRLKATLGEGEKTLVTSWKEAADLAVKDAQRELREAHESGDSDKLVEAQTKLNAASIRLDQVTNYRPTMQPLQEDDSELRVPQQQQYQPPRLDPKTVAWQERNKWFGSNTEMTALALGLHQRLEQQYGGEFIGTDEYWQTVDSTLRRRFPEEFGDEVAKNGSRGRASNVVAPASRSTSPKKIVLKQSQVALAKKLGLTVEQYAREFAKTEK